MRKRGKRGKRVRLRLPFRLFYFRFKAYKFDSENLYIEGDNLEVLKLLQGPYHKKVKMIYIDPPYNTGHDFVYPDNFKDSIGNYKALTGQTDDEGKSTRANPETSGRYHTDWLNMMYPRLILARNLLTDDGVIFISIDDSEQDNLKKICNEVFGEENALYPFIWPLPRGINAGQIAKAHEYIVAYSKNVDLLQNFNRISNTEEISIERCNKKIDARHPESDIDFPAGIPYIGPDKVLEGKIGESETLTIKGKMVLREGKLAEPVTISAGWTMKNMILKWLNGEKVYDSKGQEIEGFFFKENGRLYSRKNVNTYSIKSLLSDMPDTQKARVEMEDLFGSQDIFSYPKTIALPKLFTKLVCDSNSIVLDFFSGSATTAHAVQQLNAEDGGNRKYIMVQLPEVCEAGTEAAKAGYANICEIGKERIRRAAKKIKGEHPDWNGDMGFKVFKLDTSNLLPWNPNADELEQNIFAAVDNVLEGRTTDDLLHEILLKCNLPLTLPIETKLCGSNTIYLVGAGALAICLDKNIPASIAEEIVRLRDEYAPIVPMQVVFRDNGFNDVTKTNALQILKQAGFEEKSIQTI